MKSILYICDWDFTLLWHKVMNVMPRHYENITQSALVVGGNFYNFLDNNRPESLEHTYLLQSIEKIEDELEDEENRFSRIEKEFEDFGLWRFAWADRSWVYSEHNEIKRRI